MRNTTAITYWLAAAMFWLGAALTIIGTAHDWGMAAVWAALGAVFVALAEQSRRRTNPR